MSEIGLFGLSFAVGLSAGALYFWGLWWTVRKLPGTERPAFWVLVSFLVRAGACLGVFYLVMGLGVDKLLVSLLGFMIFRVFAARRFGPSPGSPGGGLSPRDGKEA